MVGTKELHCFLSYKHKGMQGKGASTKKQLFYKVRAVTRYILCYM